MHPIRVIGVLTVAALLASSCGSGSGGSGAGPLTVAAYAASITEIGDHVTGIATGGYPVSGELFDAAMFYFEIESGVNKLGALDPPAELAEFHLEVVATFGEVQASIARYLQESGFEGEEFALSSIFTHPEISSLIISARETCRELIQELTVRGESVTQNVCFV